MIIFSNCPKCMKLVKGQEFPLDQKEEEKHMQTNRERIFNCSCGTYWYGSKQFPGGNITEKEQ